MLLNKVKLSSIKLILIAIIALFAIVPLFSVFFQMSGNDWQYVLQDNAFHEAIKNSILYTSISTVIVILLAIICAYFLDRSSFKHKRVIEFLFNVPLLIPSLSIGLGTKLLFGKNGFLDKWFGMSNQISNMSLLIICSVIALFPVAFTTIYDAMKYEDKSVYLSASILGISEVSSFFKLKLRYILVPTIYTAFSVFSILFCDYGIPMETAGLVKTLPMYLYENMMSSFNYGRSAISILFLMMPSIVLFVVNCFVKQKSDKQTNSALPKSNIANIACIVITSIVTLFIMLPEISFISLSFIKSFPIDMSITFDNFVKAFNVNIGISFSTYILNSLLLAFLTAAFGILLSFALAYLSVRTNDKLSKVIDTIATISLTIPGMALGVCYVFFFKDSFFYNTIIILVIVNIMHMIGSPYTIAKNALSKLDSNYENLSMTLGKSRLSTFFKVILPNSTSSLFRMFGYFFMTSMTTVTAVLFLTTYKTQPMSVLITYYDKNLNYEMQSVISVLIFTINCICKICFDSICYLLDKRSNKSIDIGSNNDKPKRAIILAAGFGSRMQPLTFTTPKPLIKVHGTPMIETLLQHLLEAGITDIVIVVGYKKEQFEYLATAYQNLHIKFIVNDKFNCENNISTLMAAIDYIDRCYICEADLLVSKNIFDASLTKSCFFGFYCDSSEDWCAKLKLGNIKSFKIGGTNVYQTCGISYWNYHDSKILKQNLIKTYNSHGGKECIWDMAAFGKYGMNMQVGIHEIQKSDIIEIDSVAELAKIDESYSEKF